MHLHAVAYICSRNTQSQDNANSVLHFCGRGLFDGADVSGVLSESPAGNCNFIHEGGGAL